MRDYLFEDKEIDLQFIETLKFDEKGLIPAVIQDVDTKEVLMVAYMNKESIKETLNTKRLVILVEVDKNFGLKVRLQAIFKKSKDFIMIVIKIQYF